jgi:hypothetical protein
MTLYSIISVLSSEIFRTTFVCHSQQSSSTNHLKGLLKSLECCWKARDHSSKKISEVNDFTIIIEVITSDDGFSIPRYITLMWLAERDPGHLGAWGNAWIVLYVWQTSSQVEYNDEISVPKLAFPKAIFNFLLNVYPLVDWAIHLEVVGHFRTATGLLSVWRQWPQAAW